MANTYTKLQYHIVFSTKGRTAWIRAEIEQRVWEYLGGIARENGMRTVQVGGVEDHIHIAISIPASIAVSKAVQLIKGGSSKWIGETFSELSAFEWQKGYAAFSISNSQLPKVVDYIANQREHHRKRTFQEEYLVMLERHEIEYEAQYLWG